MVRPVLAALLVTLCTLASCEFGEKAYGRAVVNGCSDWITLHAIQVGVEKPNDITILRGGIVWPRTSDHRLHYLAFSAADGAKHSYESSAFDAQRLKKQVYQEVWVVTDGGLDLEDLTDIDAVLKRY